MVAELFHNNAVPTVDVVDPRHVISHEHNAPAAGPEQVFLLGAIGDAGGIEASAFVSDFQKQSLGIQFAIDMNELVLIGPITVADRIDNGLFDRQVNCEDLMLTPTVLLKCTEEFLEKLAPCSAHAGHFSFFRPSPIRWIVHALLPLFHGQIQVPTLDYSGLEDLSHASEGGLYSFFWTCRSWFN